MKTIRRRSFTAAAAALLLAVVASAALRTAQTKEESIKVVTSGAFTAAYLDLVPEY